MPSLAIEFDDNEHAMLRELAQSTGRSLKATAHDEVVASLRARQVDAINRRVTSVSAGLYERLA
jgi:predicted transcriptional regulator